MCLDALEAALKSIDPTNVLQGWLRVEREMLQIGDVLVPFRSKVKVIAVGKASVPMLTAALNILGKRVTSGILVSPRNSNLKGADKQIVTFHPSHPLPDEEGLRASGSVLASIGECRQMKYCSV